VFTNPERGSDCLWHPKTEYAPTCGH
jgi:hypothetical protein